MDWRALAHNRWVWLGAAGAAGLGAVAWYRRKKSGTAGAGATPTAGQTATYTPGGVGYFDSTGTDVAAQLGQYGQAVDQQLAQAAQASQQQYDAFVAQVQSQVGNIGNAGGPVTSADSVQLFGQQVPATAYTAPGGQTIQQIYDKTQPTVGGQGIGAWNLYLLNAGEGAIPSGSDTSYTPPAGTKIFVPVSS